VRQAQANSTPLDPTLIARRAKKHLDELEVITPQGAAEFRSVTDSPRRSPTTQGPTSTLIRPMGQLKVQGVVGGGQPVRR